MNIIDFDAMTERELIGEAMDALSGVTGLAEHIHIASIANMLSIKDVSGDLFYKLRAVKTMLAVLNRKIAERERA